MLDAIMGIFTSSGLGAITGLVGSYLTKVEDRKTAKQKQEFELKMAAVRNQELKYESDHELAMADKEVERAETEGAIAIGTAEVVAFKESLKSQSVSTGNSFVDAVRGAMRPVITIFLLGISTYIIIRVGELVGGIENMDREYLSGMYKAVISDFLFLTVTSVTWWFGSRPSQRK